MRYALLTLSLVFAASAAAQTPPSDARTRADVREHVFPNATEVDIPGEGRRELNRGVYIFRRSITARMPVSSRPGVEVEAWGDMVYDSHGSSYQFSDYWPSNSRLLGMPDPPVDEILALVDAEPSKAYSFDALDLPRTVTIREDEDPTWHDFKNVSVPVRITYSEYLRGNPRPGEMVDFEATGELRLQRETEDGPWTSIFSRSHFEVEEVGRRIGETGIRTLRDRAAVGGAEAYAASLPAVEVPEFQSGEALADFLYSVFLRTTDEPTLEAYLRATMASEEFIDGSNGALTINAQQWLEGVIQKALRGATPFADQFCQRPVRSRESHLRDNEFAYVSKFALADGAPGTATVSFLVQRDEAGYRNGQPVAGGWTLIPSLGRGGVHVWLEDDANAIAWLQSFDDPESMCTTAGQATQAATQEATEATGGATDRARGAVDGAVQEGRRRLGRIFGRGGN